LEEDLKKISGVEVELIPSTGGVFEITADGKSIFSKKEMKRFPEEGEIAGLLG
jgi:selenoprotein W-related protein